MPNESPIRHHEERDRSGAGTGATVAGTGRSVPDRVVPNALTVAEEQSRLLPGDRVLLAAFGAGMVWGGAVVTW